MVRAGFVGVGVKGTEHFENLLSLPGVELRAVCDIPEDACARAQGLAEKAGQRKAADTRGERDFERMCAEKEHDLVYTATPREWHTPVCLAAMRNGKHAATEIPAAVTLEECWHLVEMAEKNQHWESGEKFLAEYEHPLWPQRMEQVARETGKPADAAKITGDFMEDMRLIQALQNGVPPDFDVSDAATWSVVPALSEKSVAGRSRPMDFPDFTKGKWKANPPVKIMGV